MNVVITNVTWKQFCSRDEDDGGDCQERATALVTIWSPHGKSIQAGAFCRAHAEELAKDLAPPVDALAERVADRLFTNGDGQVAERLVMMKDLNHPLGGGWSRAAVVSQVIEAMKSE